MSSNKEVGERREDGDDGDGSVYCRRSSIAVCAADDVTDLSLSLCHSRVRRRTFPSCDARHGKRVDSESRCCLLAADERREGERLEGKDAPT